MTAPATPQTVLRVLAAEVQPHQSFADREGRVGHRWFAGLEGVDQCGAAHAGEQDGHELTEARSARQPVAEGLGDRVAHCVAQLVLAGGNAVASSGLFLAATHSSSAVANKGPCNVSHTASTDAIDVSGGPVAVLSRQVIDDAFLDSSGPALQAGESP